ncbi:MAG: polymerase sigma factor [Ilumatobacteraceae bacterium]|nr:polymerase sigma factor [Ilumatobacteraceae bacterium]
MIRLGIERPEVDEADLERLVELGGLADVRDRVARELRALPDDQRAAVELRVVRERSYEHVAVALGITQQTARARVSRGLRALSAALDDTEVRADA